MPDFSGMYKNTAHISAGIIWQICTAYSAPPGMQYIAVRGVSNYPGSMAMFGLHIIGFVLLQHDNCYYSGRGLPWDLGTSHSLTNQDSCPTPRAAARPIPEGMTVLWLVQYSRPS